MKKMTAEYPVEVTEDIFGEGNSLLADTLKKLSAADAPRVMLVADSNVVQRTEGLGSKIGKYFQTYGIVLAASPVVISGGEKIKSDEMQSALKVIAALLDAKVGKGDIILALGGGTLFDVVGYAAAQVRGGIDVVRMPTTAASMVDAAFADNAALDIAGVKDAVRVDSTPVAVLIDTLFLKTVLDGVWRGGIGEAIRFAAVSDAALMKKIAKNADKLKNRDYDLMKELIADGVAARMKKGPTPFAEWAAARLEAMSGYKLPHGYAVAIAACIECGYAVEKGLLKDDDQEFICRALSDCGALDGLAHSQHLLSQPESVLFGIDALRLATGSETVVLPSGVGKSVTDESPDRTAYAKVMKEFLSASQVQ